MARERFVMNEKQNKRTAWLGSISQQTEGFYHSVQDIQDYHLQGFNISVDF